MSASIEIVVGRRRVVQKMMRLALEDPQNPLLLVRPLLSDHRENLQIPRECAE